MWNASRFCVSSLRRGHANLLCIVPILVYVLPKQAHVDKIFHCIWSHKLLNKELVRVTVYYVGTIVLKTIKFNMNSSSLNKNIHWFSPDKIAISKQLKMKTYWRKFIMDIYSIILYITIFCKLNGHLWEPQLLFYLYTFCKKSICILYTFLSYLFYILLLQKAKVSVNCTHQIWTRNVFQYSCRQSQIRKFLGPFRFENLQMSYVC